MKPSRIARTTGPPVPDRLTARGAESTGTATAAPVDQPSAQFVTATSPPATNPVTAVERFLAAATVLGATVYVLLNGLYVEFYDEFGVRPEDVGIDRVTVLGRAAWIAIIGIALASLVFYLSSSRLAPSGGQPAAATTKQGVGPQAISRGNATRRVAVASGLAMLLAAAVIAAFFALERYVDDLAGEARKGFRVGGVGWNSELIDIRATPATIDWLGESDPPAPLGNDGAVYMYLGQGERLVALLTCRGTTVLIAPSNIQVTVLGTRAGETDSASWPTQAADCLSE